METSIKICHPEIRGKLDFLFNFMDKIKMTFDLSKLESKFEIWSCRTYSGSR